MKNKFLKLLIIIFSYSFLFVSCSKEKDKVEFTVKQYTRLLIESYSRLDTNLLKGLVSERQRLRVQQYILYELKNNEIMKCDIKKQNIYGIKITKIKGFKKAILNSDEIWSCNIFDLKKQMLIRKNEKFIYKMKYLLRKDKDKWLIYLVKGEQIDENGNVIDYIDPTLPPPWRFLSEE